MLRWVRLRPANCLGVVPRMLNVAPWAMSVSPSPANVPLDQDPPSNSVRLEVKPVLYVGTAVGHGRYIAAQDDSGKLIMGQEGKPIAFRDI